MSRTEAIRLDQVAAQHEPCFGRGSKGKVDGIAVTPANCGESNCPYRQPCLGLHHEERLDPDRLREDSIELLSRVFLGALAIEGERTHLTPFQSEVVELVRQWAADTPQVAVIGPFSSGMVVGESVSAFRFPTEENFELELPAAIRETAVSERAEISRVVVEAIHGIVIGGLLTPLGLLQAMAEYARPRGIRCGLAGVKQRLLRALQSAGICLHEIEAAKLVSPGDGPLSGYSTATRIR